MTSNAWRGSASRRTRIRAALAARLPTPCWRCGETIHAYDEWDVGHRRALVAGGAPFDPANLAPEHARRCNRAAGPREAAAVRRGIIDRRRPW